MKERGRYCRVIKLSHGEMCQGKRLGMWIQQHG